MIDYCLRATNLNSCGCCHELQAAGTSSYSNSYREAKGRNVLFLVLLKVALAVSYKSLSSAVKYCDHKRMLATQIHNASYCRLSA